MKVRIHQAAYVNGAGGRAPEQKARTTDRMTRIGVLALQGDFREHIQALQQLGVEAYPVRLPKDLAGVDGLVIPGGESTVMGKLMVAYELARPLRDAIAAGTPVWGTCAGMILLACETDNALAGQPLLATMNMRVQRNAFGAQRESFETELSIPVLGAAPYHAIFIRAPAVERVGVCVEVLARLEPAETATQDKTQDNATIVAVRQGNLLGTAFHPEVTEDLRFHEYFLSIVRGARIATPTA
jgi:5'-phosphate synthase pdxT subunit